MSFDLAPSSLMHQLSDLAPSQEYRQIEAFLLIIHRLQRKDVPLTL